ncbi:MAG: hypothetical protein ACP5RW_09085, partial [bacterium]
TRLVSLMEATFDLVAGHKVDYVDKHGVVHRNIPAIFYDEATRFRRDKLVIADEGLIEGNTCRLVIKQSTLRQMGIVLTVDGYFIINGERWDFAHNEPAFQANLTPFKGATNMFILMYVVRSEWRNNTVGTGSEEFSVEVR